jgi:RNA polymerase sigma-70 factor (ECF subfamily)
LDDANTDTIEPRMTPSSRETRLTPAGPEIAFRTDYARLVRSLALIAGDVEEASDAVQEGFIQACVHWRRVGRYEDPVGWIRRVAINRLKNRHRSRRRHDRAIARLDPPPAAHDPDTGIDIDAALGALPERQRIAVVLRYYEGLTTPEIATAMNVSEGSVATHLHRARAALRRHLEVT